MRSAEGDVGMKVVEDVLKMRNGTANDDSSHGMSYKAYFIRFFLDF